ncbi:MAG TPA: DNA-binding protein [bacterium]|nr:DNA-binding protein [bacterium]
MEKKRLFSTMEMAKILGISRIAVFKKIKSGEIKAIKVGRNYVISDKVLNRVLSKRLTPKQKKVIETAVHKTVKEYGDVLQRLGRE